MNLDLSRDELRLLGDALELRRQGLGDWCGTEQAHGWSDTLPGEYEAKVEELCATEDALRVLEDWCHGELDCDEWALRVFIDAIDEEYAGWEGMLEADDAEVNESMITRFAELAHLRGRLAVHLGDEGLLELPSSEYLEECKACDRWAALQFCAELRCMACQECHKGFVQA